MKKSRLLLVILFGAFCLLVGVVLSFFSVSPGPEQSKNNTPVEFRRFSMRPPIESPKKITVDSPASFSLPPTAPGLLLLPSPKYSYLPLGGLFGFTSSVSGTLYKGITNARWSDKDKTLSFASSGGGWSLSFQAHASPVVRFEKSDAVSIFASSVVEAMGGPRTQYIIKKEDSVGENIFITGSRQGLVRYRIIQTTDVGVPIIIDYERSSGAAIVDSGGYLRYFSLSEPVALTSSQPTTTVALLSLDEVKDALGSGAGALIGTNANKEGNVTFDFTRLSLSSVALVYAVDTALNAVYPAFLCAGNVGGGADSDVVHYVLRAEAPTTTPEP